MRFIFWFLCVVSVSLNGQPRNVIIFIGDGYGLAAKTAARMALGQGQEGARYSSDPNFHKLHSDKLKYQGTLTTHSANSWITDSAPGSTVYACGKRGKVHNEAVAFDMYTMQPIETILEAAKKEGFAVGVVTTTRTTHATPADFSAHTWNRDLENEIAAQMISSTQAEYAECYGAAYNPDLHWVLPQPKIGVDIDVILGGGAGKYLPKAVKSEHATIIDSKGNAIIGAPTFRGGRDQNIDLIKLAKQRGYAYVNSLDALQNLNLAQFTPGSKAKLIGLFHSSHMSYEQDRQTSASHEPTLAEMTRIAVEVLKRKGGKKGFFLMVEGGRIDHLGHANAGGLVVRDSTFHIGCDHEIASPDEVAKMLEQVSSGTFGSDYLIKEVIAFDHAIGVGRKLLNDRSRKTLILTTSDHECGGMAVIALHDEELAQKGIKPAVRTYAAEPTSLHALGQSINPKDVKPGADWFPEYVLEEFQGYQWPKPKCATCRRIVISYGSNPIVNGNGVKIGVYPGNHTPQDVWMGAEDNLKGRWASRITGRGQLDNTDLTPIMAAFLKIKGNW